MKPQTKLGIALLIIGVLIYLFTPSHVTWGNHHYFKHILAAGFAGMGALFLIVGSRS